MKKNQLDSPLLSWIVFGKIEQLFPLLDTKKKWIVLWDRNLAKYYKNTLKALFYKNGFSPLYLEIPAGEQYKTRKTKAWIEDRLQENRQAADSALIAIGGGVILDLAGFVASTYCRGIPFISIPTTLLAMVDASYGGKNGINTPYGKNQIGTFYAPRLIFIDVLFLKTLPKQEWQNGYAEIIKYALIASKTLYTKLRKHSSLEELIKASLQIKKKIVKKDPYERGYRRILNFGHTLAHGLETTSKYKISHGLAVALGMAFASYLSYRLNFLSKRSFDKIICLLKAYKFSLTLPKKLFFEKVIQVMKQDKKALEGSIRFVLLEEIGKVADFNGAYCQSIDQDLLKEAYEFFSDKA